MHDTSHEVHSFWELNPKPGEHSLQVVGFMQEKQLFGQPLQVPFTRLKPKSQIIQKECKAQKTQFESLHGKHFTPFVAKPFAHKVHVVEL